MTEHQKLKWICDKIGYEIKDKYYITRQGDIILNNDKYGERFDIDVREIIFTSEFMDKYYAYILENNSLKLNSMDYFRMKLLSKLNNPVEYLANLIGITD